MTSKITTIDEIVEYLKKISVETTDLGPERAVYISPKHYEKVRGVGLELHNIGGIRLMREIGKIFNSKDYHFDGSELEYAWDGVGEWIA